MAKMKFEGKTFYLYVSQKEVSAFQSDLLNETKQIQRCLCLQITQDISGGCVDPG